MYLNDSWNATRNLTVSLGLRYDLPIPAYSVNNYWGVLDTNVSRMADGHAGLDSGHRAHPFPADKKDFAPRFGLPIEWETKR